MKRVLESLMLAAIVCFSTGFACAQQGPTPQPPHQVVLNFTQSNSTGLTANCFYRGSASGVYTLPGTCSKAPVTTFTDATVSGGTTYHYAVTAQTMNGSTVVESAYSNDLVVSIPANLNIPAAPSGLATATIAKLTKPLIYAAGRDLADGMPPPNPDGSKPKPWGLTAVVR